MSLEDLRPGAVGGWLLGKALRRGALAAGGREIQTAGAGGRGPGWGRGRTRGFLSIASPVLPEAGLPEKGFLPFSPQVTLRKQNTENKSQLEVSGSWGDCPASSGSFRPGRAPPRTLGCLQGGLVRLSRGQGQSPHCPALPAGARLLLPSSGLWRRRCPLWCPGRGHRLLPARPPGSWEGS